MSGRVDVARLHERRAAGRLHSDVSQPHHIREFRVRAQQGRYVCARVGAVCVRVWEVCVWGR